MSNLDEYEQKLLNGWEDNYKQGQLTLWIMLALKDGSKHMALIKDFILDATHGHISADDKSLYRALRRYNDAELVAYTEKPSHGGGPDHKVYALTAIGKRILDVFLDRNIESVYYTPGVRKLIERRTK